MVAESLRLIERNWIASQARYGKQASLENWRFQKQLDKNPANLTSEVPLERALVDALGDDWANQVPTASGLTSSRTDRRHIDLVYRRTFGIYTFYELKVASNTPLSAVMELLVRGLLYIFTRQHLVALKYDPSTQELLQAHTIHLRVLAPEAFYARYEFSWLATALTTGLTKYLATVANLALTMDFAFNAFPFALTSSDTPERLREALTGLVLMYE